MTKKRSQSRRKEGKRPATSSPISSTAIAVMERISAPEPGYFAKDNVIRLLQDNVIRLLQDSVILHQEPEFADFYLDPRQTLEAAARHFPRLSRRLERVRRRHEDRARLVYDDFRIAVLDDLGTPQFRQELRRRQTRCLNRLLRSLTMSHSIELA